MTLEEDDVQVDVSAGSGWAPGPQLKVEEWFGVEATHRPTGLRVQVRRTWDDKRHPHSGIERKIAVAALQGFLEELEA